MSATRSGSGRCHDGSGCAWYDGRVEEEERASDDDGSRVAVSAIECGGQQAMYSRNSRVTM